MRVVFLDVDGVLNKDNVIGGSTLHEDLVRRFVDMILELDAMIIVSSTWRLHPWLRNRLTMQLKEFGLPLYRIQGQTKEIYRAQGNEQRAAEILDYVQDHLTNLDQWIAIDDLDILQTQYKDKLVGHFIKTDPNLGFTEACAHEAIRLFQTM